MRAWGAPDDAIEQARAEWEAATPAPEPIEVYPENLDAFHVLIATAGQWEYPGAFGGGRLALPLTEIHACMQMLGMPIDAPATLRVMTMVNAARAVKIKQHNAAVKAAQQRA